MKIRPASAVLALLLTATGHGPAQELSARARIDSSTYLLGDRIAVSVDLTHPPGATFQLLAGDTLDGFTVLNRLPMTPVDAGRTGGGIVLSRYEPGTFVIPPIPFLVSIPQDTGTRIVSTNTLQVEVLAVAVDTTKDIRDLKPILGMPYTAAEILTVLGVAALAAALAYLGWKFWKRRRRRGEDGSPLVVQRPPHVVALEALAVLREKRLWQQGRLKEYYSDLTEILRRYLEQRFGVMALEETTDEILGGMRQAAIGTALVEEAEQLLRRADLVKFAKHTPDLPEHDRSFSTVRGFVERTRPAPDPGAQTREAARGS